MKFSSQFHSIFPIEQWCYQLEASISCAMRMFTFFTQHVKAFSSLAALWIPRWENLWKTFCSFENADAGWWKISLYKLLSFAFHAQSRVSLHLVHLGKRILVWSSPHKLDFLLSDKWICLSKFFVLLSSNWNFDFLRLCTSFADKVKTKFCILKPLKVMRQKSLCLQTSYRKWNEQLLNLYRRGME